MHFCEHEFRIVIKDEGYPDTEFVVAICGICGAQLNRCEIEQILNQSYESEEF